MKVSIITATYNSSATIKDTIKSLESQTYQDIEYIIVDGASSDNTLDIVREHCSRVTHIISEPDKGIYDALNKGIGVATGDVIGFLHSDDVFAYPLVVEDIVRTFESSKSDAVYADLEYVSKDNINKVVRLWKSGEYERNMLTNGWMPPHPTFYMKREHYEKNGCFNLGFNIAADYDSLLRYLWSNRVSMSYLPKVTIKMRVGGASNRSIKNILQKTKEDIAALQGNGLSWPKAILLKNISKIPQFIKKI